MMIMSLATAVGLFIVIWKLGLLRLFRYRETRKATDGGLDLLLTTGLITVFAGTFSGVMIGIMSGLILSGLLFVSRLMIKPTKSIRTFFHGRNVIKH